MFHILTKAVLITYPELQSLSNPKIRNTYFSSYMSCYFSIWIFLVWDNSRWDYCLLLIVIRPTWHLTCGAQSTKNTIQKLNSNSSLQKSWPNTNLKVFKEHFHHLKAVMSHVQTKYPSPVVKNFSLVLLLCNEMRWTGSGPVWCFQYV